MLKKVDIFHEIFNSNRYSKNEYRIILNMNVEIRTTSVQPCK